MRKRHGRARTAAARFLVYLDPDVIKRLKKAASTKTTGL